MRKIILGSVVLVVVSLTLFLVAGTVRKVTNQKRTEEKIIRFPAFSFMTLSGSQFNSSEVKEGPILVVHFHPECEHCQYEISEIFKNNIPKSFRNVFLISSANPDSIKSFLIRFNYTDYQSVIPLVDSSYSFQEIFGRGTIPSSYIYSNKLKLIKAIHGEVKTENILNSLQQSEQN
jgi:thiol-disulfide isomerase/thioredoxin